MDFHGQNVRSTLESLTEREIDTLPYGVVKLDANGKVELYSQTEKILSGYPIIPLGKDWFSDVAPCMDRVEFTKAFEGALRNRVVDVYFEYTGDYLNPTQVMGVRLISGFTANTVWLLIQRM